MKETNQILGFIKTLPKVDLHFHLEGGVSWDFIRKYHPKGKELPEERPWLTNHDFSSFSQFLEIFKDFIRPCLVSIENYKQAAIDILQNAQKQNISYMEWNVSLKVLMDNGVPIDRCFQALNEIIVSNTENSITEVKLIAGINREFPLKLKLELLEQIKDIPVIAGLDIHGWEKNNDLINNDLFFKKAKKKEKWKIKIHAGELAGPENIKQAINDFGVTYICHGVRAYEDDKLLEVLAANNIFLELCPSSNLWLKVISDIEHYPLLLMLRKGIKVTINTDDPLIFNCSLQSEFQLTNKMGLNQTDMTELALNSLEASLLPEGIKRRKQKQLLDLLVKDT